MVTDPIQASRPQPGWFWFAAGGILLFMAVGAAGYLATVMTPLDQMAADQQAKMAAMPGWQTAVYAIAVWSGLLGAIGLLLRVSYELDRAQRQVARLRGEGAPQPTQPSPVPPTSQPTPSLAARGTSRLRQRVEPTFGRAKA